MSPESRKGQPTCALIVSHTGRPPSLSAAILPFIAVPRLSVPLFIAILCLFLSLSTPDVMFPGRIRETGECFQINFLEWPGMVGALKMAAVGLVIMSFGGNEC